VALRERSLLLVALRERNPQASQPSPDQAKHLRRQAVTDQHPVTDHRKAVVAWAAASAASEATTQQQKPLSQSRQTLVQVASPVTQPSARSDLAL